MLHKYLTFSNISDICIHFIGITLYLAKVPKEERGEEMKYERLPEAAAQSTEALQKYLYDNGIQFVKLFFTDPFGKFQSWRIPAGKFQGEHTDAFFDGSSIRGWQGIEESDMRIVPDVHTAFRDPFPVHPTVGIICDVVDPVKEVPYSRDPRRVAKAAEAYLKQSGIATHAYFGPEQEFFLFDDVQFSADEGTVQAYSRETMHGLQRGNHRNTDAKANYPMRAKEAYFSGPAQDAYEDVRADMVLAMQAVGLDVDKDTHEVAPGQHEMGTKYDSLVRAADKAMLLRYVIKGVARKHGLYATFMPKPLLTDNGSGMHVHMSVWNGKMNLFAGEQYGGLSALALSAIESMLQHAPSLLAITNPTVNSYRRLVPGFEAPTNLVFSARNRSAAVRIPVFQGKEGARFEFRCPDAASNPYLTFSAMLMAALDGMRTHLEPRKPLEKDIFHGLSEEERKAIHSTPGTLRDSHAALAAKHQFILAGGVFTHDLIAALQRKAEQDLAFVEAAPPDARLAREFHLYCFD